MKALILHGSPNADGLTAACAKAAAAGAQSAGAETEIVALCELGVSSCGQCGNGWGKCAEEGWCVQDDDFAKIREKIGAADALVIVTPVYYGDLSEVMKNFLDRLRRCERGAEGSTMRGKIGLCVSAAGGSGGGTLICSQSLERYFAHMGAQVFDFVTITRRSREYKLPTIEAAAAAMIAERGRE
jgi:multimeric flavodoxin WrbA